MKKTLLLSFALLLMLVTQVWAQSRTVTGRVTDAQTGEGMPGVTVQLKGSTTASPTDLNGNYSISVPNGGGTLVFTFIGFTNQEVAIGEQSSINVRLSTDAETLQEVLVVGYGTTTQQSFTGTAKVVSGEALDRKNVSNVSQALAGEVAGVRVVNTSGQPGTVATVRIRGIGSVNGSRDPLYVVDGVPFSGSLNSINPSDIESTTVLKDAAATSIYGSRGANGVVVITTRSGRGKKSYIEADANFGTNMAYLPRYNTIKSPEQYIALGWEGIYNQGVAVGNANPTNYANTRLFSSAGVRAGYNLWNAANGAALIDPTTRSVREGITRKYDPENWEDYAFQNSARKEVNLKFGGSNGGTSYYSSFGYLDDQGYSINSSFDRLSARLNVRQEISKWLTGNLNFNYARTETNNNGQTTDSGSIFWFVDNMPSIYPLFMRDASGTLITDPIFGGNQFDYGTATARGFGGLTNAIADATYDTNRTNRNELNGNASLDFNIMEGLTFENRLGAQYYNSKYVNRGNKFYGGSASQGGSLFHQGTELTSYNLLNLLRYSKSFGQHSVEALAAHEATNWEQNVSTASGYALVDNYEEDLSNAVVFNPSNSYTNEYALESYFGQINYDFNKKYFLSATIRRDGSSRFLEDKWGTFGSVGTAWLISSEDFMSSQTILSNLKLKASYGLIGDQAGVGFYPGYDLWDIDPLNERPAFSFFGKGNAGLTWETSKMFQTGIEFGLGKYLSGTLDYYIKNTDALIFDVRVAPSQGYATIKRNAGNLRNQGFEFDLTGHILKSKDYYLDLSVNGEIFSNEITKMPISAETGRTKAIDVQAPYGWSEGHSVYDFYMREWAGVDSKDGRAMWNVVYNDLNNNNVVDAGEGIGNLADYLDKNPEVSEGSLKTTTTKTYASATQKYVGKSALPDVRGAFNLAGGFKGLELNVQFIYSLGGYAYDYTYAGLMHSGVVGSNNWHQDITSRWQKEGDITDVPRLSNNADANVNSLSTRFLTKANYLALNNVRLGYTIPAAITSRFGVGGLSVWVSGDNLWINTAREGFNPSTAEAGASDTYRYSPLSTVTAGLRVKF
ncbi:SusC/RagA family TonB-linked outer membrane protein [Rufibacter latericius]|uniref:SusC/RagA family TonB-linked outer membrane protein n=1 Tax=Rufibacter latericius TaxID=2487040 RepID=A0A3M9ML31_9BACT|nr:SusC/RagA family TonB-linked outer membrane protein [Rufibacter latericius]RNI26189.1 SusC/RagA family TonB-linked outer membrane protein [Rufibacter latericius]